MTMMSACASRPFQNGAFSGGSVVVFVSWDQFVADCITSFADLCCGPPFLYHLLDWNSHPSRSTFLRWI